MKPASIHRSSAHSLTKNILKNLHVCGLAFAIMITLHPTVECQTFTVLHSFTRGTDGGYPIGRLTRDATDNLYGTTYEGGNLSCIVPNYAVGCGTIFKLDATGKETVLYSFTGGPDGGLPQGGVIRDAEGNLYGTTSIGGDPSCNGGYDGGCGTVFKLDTTGRLTVLHSFTGGSDGWGPPSSLIHGPDGSFYGTTAQGGNLSCPDAYGDVGFGCGIVFRIDNTGTFTVVYTFTGSLDGGTNALGPGDLVRGPKGTLYGNAGGGAYQCATDGDTPYVGCGTIYKVDAQGNETVLHNFTDSADGAGPNPLVRDWAGNLYGTAVGGGEFPCTFSDGFRFGCGTVYGLDSAGNFTLLYSFTGGADGSWPGPLIRDEAGNFYGTTQGGGDSACAEGTGCGTVYKLDAAGKLTVLHAFHGLADGAAPIGIILSPKGNFYGTTYLGGAGGYGAIFKIHR